MELKINDLEAQVRLLNAENTELKLHDKELKSAIEAWREKYSFFEQQGTPKVIQSVSIFKG